LCFFIPASHVPSSFFSSIRMSALVIVSPRPLSNPGCDGFKFFFLLDFFPFPFFFSVAFFFASLCFPPPFFLTSRIRTVSVYQSRTWTGAFSFFFFFPHKMFISFSLKNLSLSDLFPFLPAQQHEHGTPFPFGDPCEHSQTPETSPSAFPPFSAFDFSHGRGARLFLSTTPEVWPAFYFAR